MLKLGQRRRAPDQRVAIDLGDDSSGLTVCYASPCVSNTPRSGHNALPARLRPSHQRVAVVATGRLTTAPPFMTKMTRSITRMSSSGFPGGRAAVRRDDPNRRAGGVIVEVELADDISDPTAITAELRVAHALERQHDFDGSRLGNPRVLGGGPALVNEGADDATCKSNQAAPSHAPFQGAPPDRRG